MTSVPTPPWRKSPRPVKQQLSQALIVETGLRILDAEGLDALSMRRVAQELDTGPASLYAHVSNKDELLELIYDLVLGEIEVREPDPANWKTQLREYAMESHRVLGRHADIARAAMAAVPTGPNALRLGEYMMALLISAGMDPRDASFGVDRLSLYIAGDAYEGSQHYARMRSKGMNDRESYLNSFVGQIKDYYRSLPPERFPMLVTYVDELTDPDGEARFEYGLDLLIDGMAARMK
ncbi:TetR/AcrR family transcriptional regulator [Nonomuraea endophytica]|uniref:AcrR family transcriptional regulator n=1 Tax=Nonomuraea endophytica TaxID=714136 RepID=A0A7W8EIL9_9ACTN|nr:TetR/AcrR family transcriptional regulator [Nonomuraea endophytica]MBB5082180.1 AcrR family transcriptional regulator [Nonomuraea endophytica]